jgi:hypothetical protein
MFGVWIGSWSDADVVVVDVDHNNIPFGVFCCGGKCFHVYDDDVDGTKASTMTATVVMSVMTTTTTTTTIRNVPTVSRFVRRCGCSCHEHWT